jgi:hypothetical protein
LFRQARLAQLWHRALKLHPPISQPNDNTFEILLDIFVAYINTLSASRAPFSLQPGHQGIDMMSRLISFSGMLCQHSFKAL